MTLPAPIYKTLILAALLACALCGRASASGLVLDLSKDLVADGIASSNMLPNVPTEDARPLFEEGIAYAFAHSIPTVTAERGEG
jgi:hypothetical protein